MSVSDLGRSGPPLDKLAVGATVGAAYRYVFRHFGALLWIAAPWLVIVAGVVAYTMWAELPYQIAAIEAAAKKVPLPPEAEMPGPLVALKFISALLPLIAGVSTAVAWHRLLLTDEQPMLGGAIFGRPFWHYIGSALLIGLITIVPLGLIITVLAATLGPMQAGARGPVMPAFSGVTIALGLLIIPAFVFAWAAGLRLSVALPARAVGDTATLRAVWASTTGNTWRLFWGTILSTFPVFVIPTIFFTAWIASLAASSDPRALLEGMIIPVAFLNVLSILTSMVLFGFLSLAYRHFLQRR